MDNNNGVKKFSSEEIAKMKIHRGMMIPIRGIDSPSFRTHLAIQDKTTKNLLFKTWGGIGDQICAEPTFRWATQRFPDCKKTLACEYPEFFAHLKWDDVYNLKEERPIFEDYMEFLCGVDQESIFDQYISHMTTNCVDYPALASFRQQLPIEDRNVILKPKHPNNGQLQVIAAQAKPHAEMRKYVAVHPGKHWETKTFPVDWWNAVLKSLKDNGFIPVLIGASKSLHGGGFVEVDRNGCVDLFDKTTLMESIWLVQQLPILICSDSSPLHMAVSGKAFIGFLATAKHQDYIMHWRKNLNGVNEWAWRMHNFSLGGAWEVVNNLPDSMEDKNVDKICSGLLEKWLPEPNVFGPWCKEKWDEYFKGV